MKTGVIGEDIALKYLLSKGFTLVDRNYRRSWGEIDIIVKTSSKLVFVEVKAIEALEGEWDKVSQFNRPEERVTAQKIKKLRKVVQTYLLETEQGDKDWTFSVCGVLIDPVKKRAKVSFVNELL